MKNVINFYYQMNIENMHLANGIYYFTYQNTSYMLTPYWKDFRQLESLYYLNQQLLYQNTYYYQMILTKENTPYLFVDQKCYCLLKMNQVIHDEISFYDLKFEQITNHKKYKTLIHFPWHDLWAAKLDYLEEILMHLEKKSYNALPIFLYFMGLGENAIQYVRQTLANIYPTTHDKLVVCHRRIDAKMSVAELYSPLDLVLDYKARDIAEYFKSQFFYQEYDIKQIEEQIISLNFSKFEYSLLFGRMLYPSFFFDLCDQIFNEEKEAKTLLLLGERMEEYRLFLRDIYYIIQKKMDIEEVRWLLRN